MMEIDVIEKTTTDIKEIDQDYRYKIEQEKGDKEISLALGWHPSESFRVYQDYDS